jgi:hypothetical protein
MLFYVRRHTCADGSFEWYVLNGHTRRRASKFFPTRAAAAAERKKLQVKLDLAKEQVLRRTPKGSAVKPTRAERGGHSGRRRMLQVGGYPTSIVLRCRVTPPFAELRQMLLVNAVNLGLHLGMPALDQDGEFTHLPARAKPVE